MLRLDPQKGSAGIGIPPGTALPQKIRKENEILGSHGRLFNEPVQLLIGRTVTQSPPDIGIRATRRLHGAAGHVFPGNHMGKAEQRLVLVDKGLCGGSPNPGGGSESEIKLPVLNACRPNRRAGTVPAAADHGGSGRKAYLPCHPVLNIACNVRRFLKLRQLVPVNPCGLQDFLRPL